MAKKRTRNIPRSDVPYAERLKIQKLTHIAEHRDDAHLIELEMPLPEPPTEQN